MKISNNTLRVYMLGLSTIILSGCNTEDGFNETSKLQTGQFVDSPVAGIQYKRYTSEGNLLMHGETNELGEFDFFEGDEIIFYVGEMELPKTKANSIITPLDLVDTDDPENTTVINISRVLQSLDQDGNPENGIKIPEQAKNNAPKINFKQNELAFEKDEKVINLIANSGSTNYTIIKKSDAIDHLKRNLEKVNNKNSNRTSSIKPVEKLPPIETINPDPVEKLPPIKTINPVETIKQKEPTTTSPNQSNEIINFEVISSKDIDAVDTNLRGFFLSDDYTNILNHFESLYSMNPTSFPLSEGEIAGSWVLILQSGNKTSGGYSIAINSVEKVFTKSNDESSDIQLKISTTETTPMPFSSVTTALTHPSTMIIIPKNDNEKITGIKFYDTNTKTLVKFKDLNENSPIDPYLGENNPINSVKPIEEIKIDEPTIEHAVVPDFIKPTVISSGSTFEGKKKGYIITDDITTLNQHHNNTTLTQNDLNDQWAVIVEGGFKPSGRHSISVIEASYLNINISEEGIADYNFNAELTLKIKESSLSNSATQAVTYPYTIVTIPKSKVPTINSVRIIDKNGAELNDFKLL